MGGWHYAAASVAGSAHVRGALPNQDHWHVAEHEAGLLAVVCDGAGSAAQAAEGAQTACWRFIDYARREPAPLRGDADPALWAAGAVAAVQEAIGHAAVFYGQPESAFACTFLAAVAGEAGTLFVQLGDGAIAVRGEAAEPWRLATQPRRGEFANETVFVTAAQASRLLSVTRMGGPVHSFALMTDGVEFLAINQARGQPHAGFFGHVLDGMACAAPGEDTAHSGWLAGFLGSEEVNRRTDDDKTLVLVVRGG